MLIALINEVQEVEYIRRISNERIDSVIVGGEIQLFFSVVNFRDFKSGVEKYKKMSRRRRRQRERPSINQREIKQSLFLLCAHNNKNLN